MTREWPVVQWWHRQRLRRQYERACIREAQRRGSYVQPEVGLPEGFEPPSAALWPPGGMHVDLAQIPATLMEPSMEAGQSPCRQEKP